MSLIKYLKLTIFSFILIFSNTCTSSEEKEKRVLLIGIDGLIYNYIDDINNPEINEPKLDYFKKFNLTKAHVGGYINTTTYQISSSGPAWSSILTGVWKDRHGVVKNDKKAVEVPTIFELLHNRYPDMKMASFVSWTPINIGHAVKGMAYATRRVDGASHPDNQGIDEFIVENLVSELNNPESNIKFIFTHLDELDGAGHKCGWCPEYNKILKKIDLQLGEIMEAVSHREKHFNEEWLVLFVSDHGHRPKGGHGLDSLVERTSVIGTNSIHLMNDFFKKPSQEVNLTSDKEQNKLVANPGIVTIVPTILSYFGKPITIKEAVAGPSLIGDITIYKAYWTQKEKNKNIEITIHWQNKSTDNPIKIFRNGKEFIELPNGSDSYNFIIDQESFKRGVKYTLKSYSGTPIGLLIKENKMPKKQPKKTSFWNF